jgi:integrase
MHGCRPLTDSQIDSIKFETLRDRALFVLGLKTGFRISELLSLRVRDVTDRVTVARRNMKGKKESRSVALHPVARDLLAEHIAVSGLSDSDWLFPSRTRGRPLSARRAQKIVQDALVAIDHSGPTGTHTMRKTFAQKVHRALDRDLLKTRAALGHKDINSTVQYLSFETEEVDEAVLSI